MLKEVEDISREVGGTVVDFILLEFIENISYSCSCLLFI